MAGSTTKKVQIWRFDREALSGFVNPTTYITDSGIELLTLAGNVIVAKYPEIKAVVFVRDFDAAEDLGLASTIVPEPAEAGRIMAPAHVSRRRCAGSRDAKQPIAR